MTWALWGGLAVAFCVLYIGIYVWMRRPKFGEGKAPDPDAHAVDPTRPPEVRVGPHREDSAAESSQGFGSAPTPGT